MDIKVFGVEELTGKVNELLKKKIKNKYNPDTWSWTPAKPEKIKRIRKEIRQEKDAVFYAAITNYQRSAKQQKVAFIFTMGNLSFGLIKQLEDKKIKYFFVDFVQFIFSGSITVALENGQSKRLLKIDNVEIDVNDIAVVLWNPPKYPFPLMDFKMIPEEGKDEFLFRKRWAQVLKELKLLVNEDVVWLPSDPFNGSQEWQNKIGEYYVAQQMKLNIPPLIFTNDYSELEIFTQNHGDKLLLREFSSPPFSFPPIHVNTAELDLSNFKTSPACFQAYIDKIHEYRVVIIFDKVFPFKINSQDSKLTRHDWRVHDDANVKWELSTLPISLQKKLLKLKKKLKLNWCSVDLIYAINKKYYFLEMNRPGAHYWLDLFLDFDVTQVIISELEARGLVEKTGL